MALYHRWLCNEGSGNTVADSVGGATYDLTPISGDKVNWGTGKIFGTERSFITVGNTRFPRYDGLLTSSNGLGSNINDFTVAIVGRILTVHTSGAFLNLSRLSMRTWAGVIDRGSIGQVLCDAADCKYGEWAIYIFVGRSGQYMDVYINDVDDANLIRTLDLGVEGNLLGGSVIRFLSYADNSFPGGMELADVSLYNHSMSESDRNTYKNQFMGAIPTTYSFEKMTNTDFGGLFRWDENDGPTGSILSIDTLDTESVVKHEGDGGTCQAAVYTAIKRSLTEIYCQADFYIPADFDGNHDFGDDFAMLMLWNGAPAITQTFGFHCVHALPSQNVTLDRIYYRNTSGDNNYTLDGTLITKGVWHTFKMYINLTTGVIQAWLDDALKADLSGLTLDIAPQSMYWGIYHGVHPQNTGNYFYSRNHYVGESDYTPYKAAIAYNSVMRRMFIGG